MGGLAAAAHAAVVQPASSEKAPAADLEVAYLSLAPRYPAYVVEDREGVPTPLHPVSGQPLTLAGARALQHGPRSGDLVTATARVVNHGSAATGPFKFTWKLDGKVVGQGKLPGLEGGCAAGAETAEWKLQGLTFREAALKPGTFSDLTYSFKWKKHSQKLEFQAEPEPGAADANPENNLRWEQTDGLAFAILVDRSTYNRWNARGEGTFESWVQAQFDVLRARMPEAASLATIRGADQPIRIDTIRVLDDGQDLSAFQRVKRANGWDGAWICPPSYQPPTPHPDDGELSVPGKVLADSRLMDRLLQELGLIDLESLYVDPAANEVTDPAIGKRLGLGYQASDVPLRVDPGHPSVSEYGISALNRMNGQRRGYDGVYLYDLPSFTRLRFLDNNGRALAGAEISVHQRTEGRIPAAPVHTGKTGVDGILALPNRPVKEIDTEVGFRLRTNPFGLVQRSGANGLFFLRIRARGETGFAWLPITTLNLLAWHGTTGQATVEVRTRIPAAEAPARPLAVKAVRETGGNATVSWSAPPGAAPMGGYFIYRAHHPEYDWDRVGSVTHLRSSYLVRLEPAEQSDYVERYAVTSVDLDGNESALSEWVELGP